MFSVYKYLTQEFYKLKDGITKKYIIGGLSGISHLIVYYTFDVLRTKLAVDIGRSLSDREYKGMNDCASKIWKNDGIRGFYRGIWLSIPGIFIYRAMYFGLYNNFKNSVPNELVWKFIFAQFIVTVSGLTVYPIDTIRRRMMMQVGKFFDINSKQIQEKKFKNSFDCASKIFRKEGLRSFYGGWWLHFIRGVAGALTLVGYDMINIQRL